MATDEISKETKRQALEGAFSATEALINTFGSVLNGCYTAPKPATNDFSEVVNRIIPDAKPEPVLTLGVKKEEPTAPDDERLHMSYAALKTEAFSCARCQLCSARKNVVFGEGCTDRPTVLVVGEGPGEVEDNTGRPFVGPAGNYLDKWLKAIGLDRTHNVYITNIVKCRPPMNRDPLPEEKTACFAFLQQQIALIQPQAILCLGRPASSLMTGKMDEPIGALRGKFFFYDGIPMMCTYHPAAVLRDQSYKRPVWEDLKKLARYLGIEVMGAK